MYATKKATITREHSPETQTTIFYTDLRAGGLHTTHGRALAFATGVKAARPDLNVIVFTGDGDGSGIGGNHLLHAIRRNMDITVIMVNNFIYGMTGGQSAPTTPPGSLTTTGRDYGGVYSGQGRDSV